MSDIYVDRKRWHFDETQIPVCHCVPPADGGPGCLDDCINRCLFYECLPNHCPCGDQCSNRAFQQREGIKELDVFNVMMQYRTN